MIGKLTISVSHSSILGPQTSIL